MYKEKEHKELLELLAKYEMLTFESQIHLRNELNRRQLSISADDLNKSINDKISRIQNFEYLPYLGFKVEETENSFRVLRTTKAIITDILAVFFGLVFFGFGIIEIGKLLSSFTSGTEIGLLGIINAIIYATLVILGVKFLSGIKRLFDFMGFELSKSNSGITLKKRFDLKLEEIKTELSSVNLEEYKDKIILKLDNHDLLDSNANDIIQKMTIESLFQKLRK